MTTASFWAQSRPIQSPECWTLGSRVSCAQSKERRFSPRFSLDGNMFEIRHRNVPGNIQDLFQDISDIHSYNTRSSVSNNFYTQSSRLSIQVNSFSRIGSKIWNEMPISLRKLPKTVFKRKINQILFEILASEDCYIDLPVIIQKVKLNLFSS